MHSSQAALLLVLGLASSVLQAATGRSVFLNGVDISSAKNQTMQQVNISIDANGNVYIEAPHYEAQQESTFVPLGRKALVPGRTPTHRAPGPLPTTSAPIEALAPASETGDTKGEAEELKAKEGTRIPSNGSTPEGQAPNNP